MSGEDLLKLVPGAGEPGESPSDYK
jgi:hypothetical protein